jgi:hypothetical protein
MMPTPPMPTGMPLPPPHHDDASDGKDNNAIIINVGRETPMVAEFTALRRETTSTIDRRKD